MKKVLLTTLVLIGFLGFSQKNKSRKPIKKESVQQKSDVKPLEITSTEEIKKDSIISNPVMVTVAPNIGGVTTVNESEEKDYEIIANRLLKRKGWINNRNSVNVRGVEGFVKGVYVGKNKLFILLEIDNRTNINYDIESVSFITSPVQTKNRTIEAEEKVFIPIYTNQPDSISKKSKVRMVYAFDKFTIADNKTLLFVMNEIDGERSILLNIPPKYIAKAEFEN